MKSSKTRRILMLLGCAVLLVCLSVGATLAYLTSQTDPVVNTFTVGNVTIDLDEAKVDEYGVPVPSASPVTANTYKLIPGHNYTKQPTVHVAAGSEKCYLFVKVENSLAAIEAPHSNTYSTIVEQMQALGWYQLKNGDTDVDNIFYFADTTGKPEAAQAESNHVVFNKFEVKTDVLSALKEGETADPNKTYIDQYTGKTIKVTAYAIQADGFADKTAYEIWTAAGFTN